MNTIIHPLTIDGHDVELAVFDHDDGHTTVAIDGWGLGIKFPNLAVALQVANIVIRASVLTKFNDDLERQLAMRACLDHISSEAS